VLAERFHGGTQSFAALARRRLRRRPLEVHSGPSRLDRLDPVVDVLASFILSDAMAFLNLPFKLLPLAGNFIEIVVCQVAPLLLGLAFELLPVSFDAVLIHYKFLSFPWCGNIWPLDRAAQNVVGRCWFHRRLGLISRNPSSFAAVLIARRFIVLLNV
jgi:hypothetical protein